MSDLIDRNALRLMKVEECAGHTIEYAQGWKACIEWIKTIPTAESELKWIPVTEALPEEDEEVLVTVRFDGTKDVKPSVYVETASQIGGEWTSYSDEWKVARSKHHVIAWMPLPEPAIIGDVK